MFRFSLLKYMLFLIVLNFLLSSCGGKISVINFSAGLNSDSYVPFPLVKLSNGAHITGYFIISPDGKKVAYTADEDSASVNELYIINIDGIERLKLNDPLVLNGDVQSFSFSPDSKKVLYRADQDTDTVNELYCVDLELSTVTKVSGTLVGGGDVSYGLFSADNTHIVYKADQDQDNVAEIYSVECDGTNLVQLNPALVGGGVVGGFRISPDGTKVVYYADEQVDNKYELFVADIGVQGSTKLSDGTNAFVTILFYSISNDSLKVVYKGDQDTSGLDELYAVNIDGSNNVKMNGALVGGAEITGYAISPDSNYVVYYADQDVDDELEIYSTTIDGVTRVQLNPNMVAGGDIFWPYSTPLISSDGQKVVYAADQESDNIIELFSVDIDGGNNTKISDPMVAGGDVQRSGGGFPLWQISPDGRKVIYVADQETDDELELFSTNIDGGGTTKLNGTIVAGGNLASGCATELGSELGFNSEYVTYKASKDTVGVDELYAVNIYGGESLKLNPEMVAGGDVGHTMCATWNMSPTESRIVYYADQETDGVTEIFSVGY